MAGELIIKNGINVSGSIIATSGFTGSFSGSFTGTSTSSSFATTASFINSLRQNVAITGSTIISGSLFSINSSTSSFIGTSSAGPNINFAPVILGTGPAYQNLIGVQINPSFTQSSAFGVTTTALRTTRGDILVAGGGAIVVEGTAGSGQEATVPYLFHNSRDGGYDGNVFLSAKSGSVAIGTQYGSSGGAGSNGLLGLYGNPRNVIVGTGASSAQNIADNVIIGFKAFYPGNISNSNNVIIGSQAVGSGATGGVNNNTIVGYQAFYTPVSGRRQNTVAIGYQANYSASDAGIYIGYQAGLNETGSNRLYIANSSTSTPLIGGDFSNKYLGINISPNSTSATLHVKGSGATSATTALRVENSSASPSLLVLDNGTVGINTGSISYNLDVNGSVAAKMPSYNSVGFVVRNADGAVEYQFYNNGNNATNGRVMIRVPRWTSGTPIQISNANSISQANSAIMIGGGVSNGALLSDKSIRIGANGNNLIGVGSIVIGTGNASGSYSISISSDQYGIPVGSVPNDYSFNIGSSVQAATSANNQGILNALSIYIGRAPRSSSFTGDTGNGTATTLAGMGGYGATDATGGNLTIGGGQGLGAGTPGDLIFSTATTGSSGVVIQSLSERARFKANTGFFGIGISSPSASLHVSGSSIFNGNVTITGSLIVSSGITGSFSGSGIITSASFAVSSSRAVSASYAPSTPTFPYTGSALISGSLDVSGSIYSTGVITAAGNIEAQTYLKSMYQAGDEGGEIFLNAPATNTTIINGVTIDVYQDRFRIFEQGGAARGYFLDIPSGGAGVGTDLKPAGYTGTVTIVGNPPPNNLNFVDGILISVT